MKSKKNRALESGFLGAKRALGRTFLLNFRLLFVPGLIAFAVDFTTGTIFLPEGEVAANALQHPALIRRSIPKDRLSIQAIEQVVSAHARQPIRLEDGQYEMHTLEDIEDFWSKHDQLVHKPV